MSSALKFRFLTDLTAIHYPNQPGRELAVVYHLHNLVDNVRLRFKLFVPVAKPDVFTATALYESANWMERETFDFFGVNFVGHPNLKRILNVDEMEYFPMRKEFPMEDQTRIDKDDAMFGRGGRTSERIIERSEGYDRGKARDEALTKFTMGELRSSAARTSGKVARTLSGHYKDDQ